MNVQQGMDTARIREIAAQLTTEANRLDDVLDRGNSSAGILQGNWEGDDGQALLVRWRTTAVKQLGEATETLRQVARTMKEQATDQDTTSKEVGGGSGGGGNGDGNGNGTGGGKGNGGGKGQGKDDDSISYVQTFERPGKDSDLVKVNKDKDGNTHYYDPVTGKRWQEAEDGSWKREQDPRFGRSSETKVDQTKDDDGTETTHESTRGKGPLGTKEYGESWSKEKSFDDGSMKDGKKVLDGVQTEPVVEKTMWDKKGDAEVWEGGVGDEKTGASAKVLAAEYATEGKAGFDVKKGAYLDANAEASAYLAKGEAHWTGDHGTSAKGEAFVGAEAKASGEANIGPGGAKVGVNAEAFAGGKAEGEVKQDLGPAEVGVGGEVSYGIGGHASADAEVSMDKVGVKFDVSATLGIGGGIKADISVSPKEIISGVGDAGKKVVGAINPWD